ncbi:MAG: glycosyltransferase [Cyanobacteriota bacterium]|nr:glycosyltransferase [Cyanobacteriota bacterium]
MSHRSSPAIAFTIDSLKLGGAERTLLRWAVWCRDAGWRVVVITRKGPERDGYPLPSGLIRRQEPRLSSGLERLGWWAFPARVLALRSLLQQESVSIAVGVTVLPAVKLLLASRGLPIRCLVSERNYPPARSPALPWRWLRRLSYPWADLHLVQTTTTGDWLRRHCSAHRQLLLPNPVIWPLPSHEPVVAPESLLPDGAPLILAAGTKAHQKGFDRLMPMFAALADRWPRLRLAVLGLSDQPYQGVRQQTWLRGLLGGNSDHQKRLLMPGAVGNMAHWYARASLFVLPSRFEGFPNVLLEAMAAGCACVASDCRTGPSDLIEDSRNGRLLAQDASIDQWIEVLELLLHDIPQRSQLAQNAKAVRERFSEQRLRESCFGSHEGLSQG